MLRPATETRVQRISYSDADTVKLVLQRPNIEVVVGTESVSKPWAIAHAVRTTYNGRFELHGDAFTDLTKGRQQRRWQWILDRAIIEESE